LFYFLDGLFGKKHYTITLNYSLFLFESFLMNLQYFSSLKKIIEHSLEFRRYGTYILWTSVTFSECIVIWSAALDVAIIIFFLHWLSIKILITFSVWFNN